MRSFLLIVAIFMLVRTTEANENKSLLIVKRIKYIEHRFEKILSSPKKSTFKEQRKLLVETFAALDQGVTYAAHQEKIDSTLSDSLAKISFLAATNSPGGFARRRVFQLYKKHPESLRQSIQRLPPEQSAFLFKQIKEARER